MSLVGLTKRSTLCKICTCILDDNVLNELTLDILNNRKTYAEIIETYNKYIPDFVNPLNQVNITNHKKHCDPALIAEDVLKRKGEAVTEGDFAAVLYAQRFKERFVDKQDILHSLYKMRINSIQFLRELLLDKQNDYNKIKFNEKHEDERVIKQKLKVVELEIRKLLKDIDDIEDSLQGVVLQDLKVEKGPGNTYINQNIVNVMESNLKDFINEFVPYLLYKAFPGDLEKGKEVVAYLSTMMDKHLAPTMKKLNQVNERLN
jgi:uncharacterized protein YqgV (UPF0045/DUF77 family)